MNEVMVNLAVIFLSAFGAKAIEFKAMVSNRKAMSSGDFVLQFLNARVVKLQYGATIGTDEVVMMLFINTGLVAGLPISEVMAFGQTALGQQFERPMYSRIANLGMIFTQFEIEVFGGGMGSETEKLVKNDLPLSGTFKPLLGQVVVKNFFDFLHTSPLLPENDFQDNRGDGVKSRFFSRDP